MQVQIDRDAADWVIDLATAIGTLGAVIFAVVQSKIASKAAQRAEARADRDTAAAENRANAAERRADAAEDLARQAANRWDEDNRRKAQEYRERHARAVSYSVRVNGVTRDPSNSAAATASINHHLSDPVVRFLVRNDGVGPAFNVRFRPLAGHSNPVAYVAIPEPVLPRDETDHGVNFGSRLDLTGDAQQRIVSWMSFTDLDGRRWLRGPDGSLNEVTPENVDAAAPGAVIREPWVAGPRMQLIE